MGKDKMKDSLRAQVAEACGSRSAADLMRLLMSVRAIKEREFPDDKPESSRLWVKMSPDRMAQKLGISRAQVYRALSVLVRRGFVVREHANGQAALYQIRSEAVIKYLQPMELFDGLSSAVKNPSHSEAKPVSFLVDTRLTMRLDPSHHETGFLISNRPIIDPSSSNCDDDDNSQKDEEREILIDLLRSLNIARERSELLLTQYSRQLIKAGISWVRSRSGRPGERKEPAGALINFLKAPAWHGFECDRSGCWRPASEIAKAEKLHKSRTVPRAEISPAMAEALAWDEIGARERSEIIERVSVEFPSESQAKRLMVCRRRALALLRKDGVT